MRTYPKYQIVLADPPWKYYGSTTKNAAAGKHYDLMDTDVLAALNPKSVCAKDCALFLWATGPMMHKAIELMRLWGFHYRGVAFIWIKTTKAGVPIGPRGVPPTFVKPVTEFVLAGSSCKTGRPIPLQDFAVRQLVLAPVREHSRKPTAVHSRIEGMFGDVPRLEMFARRKRRGWDCWGDEVNSDVVLPNHKETSDVRPRTKR